MGPEAGPVRIASLVPSATELLCALGLAPWLVARTGFCVHPADLLAKVTKVGGTKDIRWERLRAANPSHVLLNVDENTEAIYETLRGWPGVELIVTHPCGPREVPALIAQCRTAFAGLADIDASGLALEAELQAALAEPAGPQPLPRSVLYLIWREPWMSVARDTYISRLLLEAGWQTHPAEHGGAKGAARYPLVQAADWAAVDEVWLSSEPYRFRAHHLAEVQCLAPQARVRLVDGELCSWWGARTAAGLAYLRALHGA